MLGEAWKEHDLILFSIAFLYGFILYVLETSLLKPSEEEREYLRELKDA